MSLVDEARKLESGIVAKNADLERRAAELDAKEIELGRGRMDVEADKRELEKLKKEVEKQISAVRHDDELSRLETELAEERGRLSRESLRLRTLENDLALVAQRQEVKEVELRDRESALSRDKEQYKEKLKAEFLDQVNKKLSGGL